MYKYAYIFGILLLLPLWSIFFFLRKDLRKPMSLIGVSVGTLAILTDFLWFLKDYWNPLKSISKVDLIWQDFLLGFFLGGILSVSYEFFSMKKIQLKSPNYKRAFIILIILLSPFLILTNLLSINSIYASITGLLLSLIFILLKRKELIINALYSGTISLLLTFFVYALYKNIYPNFFTDWWKLDNLTGHFLFKIPLEEIIWFLSFGLITGTLYNFFYSPDKNQKET